MLSRLKRLVRRALPKKQKPFKLVMTLLVRDEQDILRANIEFHLAMGVDFIIATDNKSVDSTPDILKEYQAKGLLHYIYEGDDDYNQTAWVTRMARMAANDFDATWVINNDADEFWWPMSKDNLKDELKVLPPEICAVSAERRDFVPVEGSADAFASKMIYKEKQSYNAKGKPLPPKVAHRAIPHVEVVQGNHGVWGFPVYEEVTDAIEIQHFPLRSYKQFENKIVKGGQAYERNEKLGDTAGATWKGLYEEYKKGNLMAHYKEKEYSPERLQQGLDSGELLLDERLPTLLKSLKIKDNVGL